MTVVYKILGRAEWDEAQRAGAFAGSAVDLRDGYVHLSAPDQARETAARHFADRADLVLLAVDPARLPPGALRWEPSRRGALFPHLYGPLPCDAVVSARDLPRGPDGALAFPDDVPGG